MRRGFFIAGVAVLGILFVGIVVSASTDPLADRARGFEEDLNAKKSEETPEFELRSSVDYRAIEDTIQANRRLWAPVVQRKKRAPSPPDLGKVLKGVKATRIQVGPKVKFEVEGNAVYRGEGESIRGLIITEVSSGYVEFSKKAHGKTYTHRLPRN